MNIYIAIFIFQSVVVCVVNTEINYRITMRYAIYLILLILSLIYAFNFFTVYNTAKNDTLTTSSRPSTPATPANTPVQATELSSVIEKKINKNSFNGVVLIADKDKIVFNNSYGYANIEQKIKNNEKTEFLIGSITKLFTATAILKLEELGKIDLHNPISSYLKPDNDIWGGNFPSFADTVTIHDLLSFSSGIEDHRKFSSFVKFDLDIKTPSDLLQFYSDYPLRFKPGSYYDYTGSNYNILGAIIEEVTKMPLNQFFESEIFKPLHMNETKIAGTDFLNTLQEKNPELSIGYIEKDKNSSKLIEADEINLSTLFADSSAISTAEDLYVFIKALFQGKIISQEALKKITTPYFETHNKNLFAGYGLFIINDNPSNPIYVSSGTLDGYEAIVTYEPKSDTSIIILSNVNNGKVTALAKELAELLKK